MVQGRSKVCVIQSVQNINKDHPASYLMAPEALAPRVRSPECEADHSSLPARRKSLLTRFVANDQLLLLPTTNSIPLVNSRTQTFFCSVDGRHNIKKVWNYTFSTSYTFITSTRDSISSNELSSDGQWQCLFRMTKDL